MVKYTKTDAGVVLMLWWIVLLTLGGRAYEGKSRLNGGARPRRRKPRVVRRSWFCDAWKFTAKTVVRLNLSYQYFAIPI